MKIYVSSRTSYAGMWRGFRQSGVNIVSMWIDEAGPGETDDYIQFWDRVQTEIALADRLVLYVEEKDFPLKGAFIETGMALAFSKPVFLCAPGVAVDLKTFRPLGSWIAHRRVTRNNILAQCLDFEGK